jgi:large subunit ribosomal protein L10
MNRIEKSASVESLKQKFSKAQAAFLTEYRGMSVEKLYELRKKVREGQGELRVVKNRLAKIAAKGSSFEGIASDLKGPIAIAFAFKDAVAVAKAVSDSLSDTSPLKVKMGYLDGKAIDSKGVTALSKLPPKEVLLSMLLGTLKAPMQNFANVVAAVPRDLANVLTAVKDKKPST